MTSPAAAIAESEVLAHYQEISVLGSVSAVLGWDMESMMPSASADLRGRQLAALAALLHTKQTDSKYVNGALALQGSVHAPRLRRGILNQVCVDADYARRLSESQVRCQDIWKRARKASDFSIVEPALRELVALQREWCERFRAHPLSKQTSAGRTNFEIAFGNFEPEFRQAELDALLDRLGPELARRVPEIVSRHPAKPVPAETLAMPIDEQKKLVRRVAEDLGFDFTRGRLDESAHPFCGGNPEDTRITVRYLASDFTNAVSSVVHEVGHGIYEQSLPRELLHTPVGEAASLGIHESQSRFLENQIGRSRAFCEYLGRLSARDPAALYAHLNQVRPSLIRVDADEVTYNLHILIRVGIERALLNGDAETADIPRLWNEGYARYLGIAVPDEANGCLQDVHWYGGAFGYFATYTLGNLIAANLFADFRAQHPDWESRVAQGDFAFVKAFSNERVHRHAALHDSPATIGLALSGRELTVEPFLAYVDAKYLK